MARIYKLRIELERETEVLTEALCLEKIWTKKTIDCMNNLEILEVGHMEKGNIDETWELVIRKHEDGAWPAI